jgi:hypothetical protein
MGYRIKATLTGETSASYQLLLDWAISGEGNEYETVVLPKNAIIETYRLIPIIKRGHYYGQAQHQFYEPELASYFIAPFPIWGFIDAEISTAMANIWGLSEKSYKRPLQERRPLPEAQSGVKATQKSQARPSPPPSSARYHPSDAAQRRQARQRVTPGQRSRVKTPQRDEVRQLQLFSNAEDIAI